MKELTYLTAVELMKIYGGKSEAGTEECIKQLCTESFPLLGFQINAVYEHVKQKLHGKHPVVQSNENIITIYEGTKFDKNHLNEIHVWERKDESFDYNKFKGTLKESKIKKEKLKNLRSLTFEDIR